MSYRQHSKKKLAISVSFFLKKSINKLKLEYFIQGRRKSPFCTKLGIFIAERSLWVQLHRTSEKNVRDETNTLKIELHIANKTVSGCDMNQSCRTPRSIFIVFLKRLHILLHFLTGRYTFSF